MRVELSIEVVSDEGVSTSYSYVAELPDKWSLEVVEAHSANMLKVLDRQATNSDDDDEDSEKWKEKTP